jgi:hypothetical protein
MWDMNDPSDERWKEPCKQAIGERDPEKLMQLTREIIRLLEARQNTNGDRKHLGET